ncbi:BMP family ABC transporter substrate-binding protein [Alphaproteobacteria bacterium]|nr:BMP family ABC transporter substrate-binding protein [Alphaproteobacteria bacterium]
MNGLFSRRAVVKLVASSFIAFSAVPAFADDFKVAIVLPGISTDKSFNQNGYEGVKQASERLGFEFAYSEKVPQPDQVEALADYARRGYKVVIGHGGEFQESVERVAKRFPGTKFIVVNGVRGQDNVSAMTFDFPSMGYVVGYVAGRASESKVGAYIGAQKIKAYTELGEGFEKGFKAAAGDKGRVVSAWTNDWDDVAKGKEAALNVISQGADVIFPSMDNAVAGSLQAADEKGKKAIGIYYDAIADWPNTVIQSAVFDMKGALATILANAKDGKLEGKLYVYGFETPSAMRLGTYAALVKEDVRKEVDAVISDIKSGQAKGK